MKCPLCGTTFTGTECPNCGMAASKRDAAADTDQHKSGALPYWIFAGIMSLCAVIAVAVMLAQLM